MSRCSICDRSFPLRKTMLRHARTVHSSSKTFACSKCGTSFSRKDTLERHLMERHALRDRLITCLFCNRSVSTRAFSDHLRSRVCEASRAVASNTRFDMLGFLLPNQDEDCFLLAMRLLETWKDQPYLNTGRELFCQPSSVSSLPYEPLERLKMESRTLGRLSTHIVNTADRQSSLKLYCTALALCFASFARFYSHGDEAKHLVRWSMHMQGARHIRTEYHNANCSCLSAIDCSSMREVVRQDPALSILLRTLDNVGLARLRLGVLALPSRSITRLWDPANLEEIRGVVKDWVQPNELDSEWPDLRRLEILPNEFGVRGWLRSNE